MRAFALAQDFRFALRQIRRAPLFAASAILTLALGVGANTGVFSLLNGYLRPLPVPNGDRIVVVAAEFPGDETGFRYRFSFSTLEDFRSMTRVFSDVFGFDTRIGGLTAGGKSTQFVYHIVTGNFFAGLQIAPAAGRLFVPGEGEHAGAETVIVLGHTYWLRRFGGDPAVVGRAVRLDGDVARIIGVAPEGFHGLYQGAEMEGYVPIGGWHGPQKQMERLFTDRTFRFLTMVARLQPGVTLEGAQDAVNVLAHRLQATYPAEKNVKARVLSEPLARPIPMRFLSDLIPLVRLSMLGLAALVLLIACMNVANLLLVRATVRQREMAVRTALGSDRARLLQLLFAESVLLSICGTVAGLLLARWATDLFLGSLNVAIDLPLNLDFHYDWRVFSYAALMALGTGVVMGVVPAFRASRVRIAGFLHDGGHGGSAGVSRQRLRSALVVAQVAGSLVLLVVAGLFVRSLHRAEWVDLGFDPSHVLNARLDPHQIGYTLERSDNFYDELDRRIRSLAGVESVSMAFSVPLGYIHDACLITPEGVPLRDDEPHGLVGCNPVTSEYFATMRIPIVKGRAFTPHDTKSSAPVVIVNETLAGRLWPHANPIGKRVNMPRVGDSAWEVVGVARDSKYLAVFEKPLPHVYLAMTQTPSFLRIVQVRTTGEPEGLAMSIQKEVQALDADMPVADLKTMQQTIDGGMGFLMFRIGAIQATAMGVLGLLLAIVGVYGVVSYGASQRTREMGIRLALGAGPAHVRALVLRQGLLLVTAGIACGLLIAAGVTRLLSTFFFLVSASDGLTFAVVTAVLSAIALMACYLPARRAMRLDPMAALRHE
jgi:predicted permease